MRNYAGAAYILHTTLTIIYTNIAIVCCVFILYYDSIAASAVQMQAIAGQQYDASGAGSQGGIISSAFTNMRTVAAFSVQHKVRVYPSTTIQCYMLGIFLYFLHIIAVWYSFGL